MNSSNNDDPNQTREHSSSLRREDVPPEYLGSVLRAEIMPADEAPPVRPVLSDYLQRINLRYLALLVVLLIIIGSGIVCFIGPGKPFLENSLMSLRNRDVESTVTITPRIILTVMSTTIIPPTSTIELTETPTRILPSTTPTELPTGTPTQEDACVNPLEINLDDVGNTLCVRGVITGMEEREVGFIVYFSDERGIFYLVTYDFVWDQAEPGDCIQITGEIQQLSNTPVLVFGWNNIPEFCP